MQPCNYRYRTPVIRQQRAGPLTPRPTAQLTNRSTAQGGFTTVDPPLRSQSA